MAATCVGALDAGTTSVRFLLVDRDGRVVGSAQREHRQIYPRAGWVEHDPLEIWANCRAVIADALTGAGLSARDLAAVGVTNQRETTIVWDRRSGSPVHNAIVWQDTRTDSICAALAGEGGGDRVRELTGLPLATYFSGPKVRWILDNVAGARDRAEAGELCFGTVDAWCIWQLTGGAAAGVHVTDVTNASRTQLANLHTLAWDAELLDVMRVPRAMLPQIRASSGVLGEATGELDGVPIAAALGDQHAALFGQCCFTPGEAKNTYGTGCFVLLNTGASPVPSRSGLVTTVAYQLQDTPAVYALEGSIAVTGALVQWLRDNLELIHSADEIEALAASVADTAGVCIVPAFSGLFAPYWRSDARGVITGLTRYTNRAHIARAALEATAWQTREVVDAMRADCGLTLDALRVDGGMVRNALLMQLQADALGVPVVRPAVTETTALGAAFAAGLAVGFWPDLETLRRMWTEDARWLPELEPGTRERAYAQWKKAVTRTFGWLE